ncbi:MAG: trypsin-like peptidase domain-containing protein [Candidatus Krumholzibacteriota bacterium]
MPGPARGQVNDQISDSPFVAVSRAVRPAVVNIRITRSTTSSGIGTGSLQEMYRRFFPDEEGKGGRFESPSTGSGFVVDPAGDILTNHHVIDGADAIFVRFSGEKQEYRADLIGTDPNTDLALLRIDPAGRELPVLKFGDSDLVEVGSWAIAIGNPFGNLESTLTVGVVSAKGRGDLKIGGLTPRYQDFIQTDASINFGNSGGPLVDVRGRLIGVNTAINQRGQGIGFAVPSNLVTNIYRQLGEHGRVIRGYLGIVTEDIVQVVGEEVPGQPQSGARIISIMEQSPAAAGGLQGGDVVVEYAGQKVESRRQLLFLIAGSSPGRDVEIVIVRDGERNGFLVRPVEWIQEESEASADMAALWLGMEVASVEGTDPRVVRLREALGVTATTGVLVVAVQDGQPAAEAGIRPGDLVVSIAGHEIIDLESYDQVRTLLAPSRDLLSVLVRTGNMENYVSVQPRHGGLEN